MVTCKDIEQSFENCSKVIVRGKLLRLFVAYFLVFIRVARIASFELSLGKEFFRFGQANLSATLLQIFLVARLKESAKAFV